VGQRTTARRTSGRPATATCHVVKMATSTSNTDAESTVIQSSENVDFVDSEGGSDGTSSSARP